MDACHNYAQKMGIKNPAVIRQAEELLRLTEVRRQSLTGLNLPSSCQAVLCLELAAGMLKQDYDKSNAWKLSGVNQKTYKGNLKALERVLELQSKSSVRELAVQFGCVEAVDLAQKVLAEYQKSHSGENMELDTVLCNAAALHVATRKLKIKVDKTKLSGVGGSKKSVFDRLGLDMEKRCADILDGKSKENPRGKKRQKSFLETLDDNVQDHRTTLPTASKMKDNEKFMVDDYEEWKKRILDNARKQLKLNS